MLSRRIFLTVGGVAFMLPLLMLSSCSNWKPLDSIGELSIDRSSISVLADNEDGSRVTDTLKVSSNRSWSVRAEGEPDWLTLSVGGDLNVSGAGRDVYLVVSFDNNTALQDRNSTLVFTSEDRKIEVPVKQGKIVYRLKPISPTYEPAVSHLGATYVVEFNSNTSWTAEPKPTSTTTAILSKTSGVGNGRIVVTIPENHEYETRNYTLVLKAEGCQDLEYVFDQESSRPYVLVDKAMTDTTLVQSIGAWRHLAFRTNVNWTATYEGDIPFLTLKSDGEPGTYLLRVQMDGNPDFDNRRSGKIVITPEGGDPVEVRYIQEKLSIISLVFRLYPDVYENNSDYRNWPFGTALDNNKNDQLHTTLFGEYPFFFHYDGTSGNMVYNQCGLLVGNTTYGGFIDLPAIEGKTLKKVEVFVSNESQVVYAAVTDADDKQLTGGDKVLLDVNESYKRHIPSVSIEQELTEQPQSYACWELRGTQPNTSYRLRYYQQRMNLRWITLTYE